MDSLKFADMLMRYRLNEVTESERVLIEQWYEGLDQEKELCPEEDAEELGRRLWERIARETSAQPTSAERIPLRYRMLRYWRQAIAAAAVLTGLIIWKYAGVGNPPSRSISVAGHSTAQGYAVHANNTLEARAVVLSDSTLVILSKGASLKAPIAFSGDTREVYLEGEAFFDVRKDSSKPFFVFTDRVTTHVLGTKFSIKPLGGDRQIEVSVHSGRVEVFETRQVQDSKTGGSGNTVNGVVLTPNHRVVYHMDYRLFESSLMSDPRPLNMEDQQLLVRDSFNFLETPLRDVLQAVSETYGIEILLERTSLNECPFTGDISEQDLFQKLDIINKALGTTYEVVGTKILIKGDGCG